MSVTDVVSIPNKYVDYCVSCKKKVQCREGYALKFPNDSQWRVCCINHKETAISHYLLIDGLQHNLEDTDNYFYDEDEEEYIQ